MAIEMKYCMACGTKLTEKYLELAHGEEAANQNI
jgi:hypothetical protein